ncbi:MAG TPA: restriction endonuclease subunit S [Catenibacterium sp.]|nr:restriction endonuclease subunit S [Catenibacterium sp.]
MLVKMKDICTKIGSGATPKGGNNAYIEEGTALIRSQNILDFSFSYNGLAYINYEQASKLNGVTIKEDDVLLNITGDSVARACMVDNSVLPARVNQHVCIVRGNKSRVLSSFILYFLQMKKPELLMMASSGATRNALTKGMIEELEVELPSLEKQERMVSLLDNLQNKISKNNQINRNLSEQAQSLFKSWFIQLDPFNGEVPENWSKGMLKDILQLRKDGTKAGKNTELPYLPIDVIPMNDLSITEVKPNEEAQSSLIMFNKNDILIGAMRVYFHRVVIAPFDGITRSTCFVLRPYNDVYLSFGLLCCNQRSSIDYAQATSKGSTMPYAIWDNGLGDMEITIPDIETASKFNKIIKPMLEIIQKSFYEVQRLQELRDILLPKLMSGELDVSDLNI